MNLLLLILDFLTLSTSRSRNFGSLIPRWNFLLSRDTLVGIVQVSLRVFNSLVIIVFSENSNPFVLIIGEATHALLNYSHLVFDNFQYFFVCVKIKGLQNSRQNSLICIRVRFKIVLFILLLLLC